MKIVCFYLPQFHETEDNNKWWGKGFTDWVTTRNAHTLFKGHIQPRIPLEEKYYDLSEESGATIKWQAELAKKYGIDAFCIYHYWFGGKKELEKPAEILLEHKEIDIEYSFCWDSGSWKRTWFLCNNEQEVLVKQDYGNEKMWEKHFYDLLPYFMDKRYIKIDNKPVFHIYRSHIIGCLSDMKSCWEKLARENGFNGIYLIAGDVDNRVGDKVIDSYYNYEPVHCFDIYRNCFSIRASVIRAGIVKRINKICNQNIHADRRSARAMYKIIEKDDNHSDVPVYYGSFVNYDDTPRRGEKGAVYCNNKPKYFEKNLKIQIEKSLKMGNPFLYINAWNEWGEGAFLEPDVLNSYTYLEIVKRVKDSFYYE